MECNKYQNGLIYTIKTDNGLYVGSTIDFTVRKWKHKYNCFNENSDKYNVKVYKNIRENGGEYTIEIYKMFPCNSDEELRIEENNVIKYLNANLNTNLAFQSVEEKKEYGKEYYKEYRQQNKEQIKNQKAEIIICECGCKTTRGSISKHRKSKKHLNLMELKTAKSASWVIS